MRRIGIRVKYILPGNINAHVSGQHKLVLVKRDPRPDETLMTSKFGMNLVYTAVAFKYPTLNTIHQGVTEILNDCKIRSEDILL